MSKAQMTNEEVFVAWAIYRHPSDYPNHFVVRRWEWMKPDEGCQLYDTLEDARESIPPGLVCIAGDSNSVIIETWI